MSYLSDLQRGNFIGNGAFGEVYLCNDPAHGDVAGKFFYANRFNSPSEWNNACIKALAEAQNMKALQHKNVVSVYNVLRSDSGDEFLIVMEYCDSGNARKICEKNVINLMEAKHIIRDTSIGLCYIHNKGFIHRDIKPDNVLMKNGTEVKIGDFGFVTDKLRFGFATPYGTPAYIAPEVFTDRACSVKSDVFSLGATFLHLTHGDHWFTRAGKGAILRINSHGEYEISSNFVFLPHLPKKWQSTIRKMIHSDPSKRYPSMDAASDAISRLPAVKDWTCTVNPQSISWTIDKGERRVAVEWLDYLSGHDSWTAWSENASGGSRRTLAKSDPSDNWKIKYSKLQKFFSQRG